MSTNNDQLLDNDVERESSNNIGYRGSTKDSVMSYVRSTDFIELIGCACFLLPAIVLKTLKMMPRMRKIPYVLLQNSGDYVVNQVFNEEYVGETVPGSMVYTIAAFIPAAFQLWLSVSGRQKDFHKTGCVYFTAIGLTLFLTDAVKIYVGYLRPIFLSRCQPDANYESCTTDDERKVRVSFPSGHSSLVFCGMLLLSFYLERRFGASKVRSMRVDSLTGRVFLEHTSRPGLYRLYSLLCYTPVLFAIFVATSRVADNMHFPADIVGGSVLGGSIAILVHGIWFPTLPMMEDDC